MRKFICNDPDVLNHKGFFRIDENGELLPVPIEGPIPTGNLLVLHSMDSPFAKWWKIVEEMTPGTRFLM